MQSKATKLMNLFLIIVIPILLVIISGCYYLEETEAVAAQPLEVFETPAKVTKAREAILDFLRDGANVCVPPSGVTWHAEAGEAPPGYEVAVFRFEECLIRVSYSQEVEDEMDYHVSLRNPEIGFCWQAVVDGKGEVVLTGSAVETDRSYTNAAELYCNEQGYQYVIEELESGTSCGKCVFPDGRSCNGWAYFYGECSP